jgi:hypothetical protein
LTKKVSGKYIYHNKENEVYIQHIREFLKTISWLNGKVERALVQFYLENQRLDPDIKYTIDDWWVGISPSLDLNLWLDASTVRGTLYNVYGGATDTYNYHEVELPEVTRKFVCAVYFGIDRHILVKRVQLEGGELIASSRAYKYTANRQIKLNNLIPTETKIEGITYLYSVSPRKNTDDRRE